MAAAAAASFVPRTAFPALDSLPRSYFLGHHRAGLTKMKSMLSLTDLIVECRDYRVPLTSRNPLFEANLAGRERVLVYTKVDLGSSSHNGANKQREQTIRNWHAPSHVFFSDVRKHSDVNRVLEHIKGRAAEFMSLTGMRVMVVGMPNVGKSSLLNALRQVGVGKGKAARTGAHPGITRKVATGVKVVEGSEYSEGVYLIDTPGVFVPYVPDAEAMLKLAACGLVKDTVIPPTLLADYLLYHINLVDPKRYAAYHPPTNDIITLLEAMARQSGQLQKGGFPDTEGAALRMIQMWRNGRLGRFILDEVTEDALLRQKEEESRTGPSLSQAKKEAKRMQAVRSKQKKSVI